MEPGEIEFFHWVIIDGQRAMVDIDGGVLDDQDGLMQKYSVSRAATALLGSQPCCWHHQPADGPRGPRPAQFTGLARVPFGAKSAVESGSHMI